MSDFFVFNIALNSIEEQATLFSRKPKTTQDIAGKPQTGFRSRATGEQACIYRT